MKTKSILMVMAWCLALCYGVEANAQNKQIAVLQHGDNMKAYYGVDAFREAMDNAQSGDLISLSSGQFNPPDSIGKAVVIQGAGMYYREWNPTPTVITEDLWIVMENENETGLVIEGISMASDKSIIVYGDIKNLSLIKCKMNDLNFSWDGGEWINENILVDRCYIYGTFWVGNESSGMVVRNSYIRYFKALNNNPANRYVSNCTIQGNEDYSHSPSATYVNNILCDIYGNDNSIYYNNLFNVSQVFREPQGSGNYRIDSYQINRMFEVQIAPWFQNDSYGSQGQNSALGLTDEAATTYLGTDGTQVGVYGGTTPFGIIPSCPQVTESEIAGQSNADGKLSVKITVEAGDN